MILINLTSFFDFVGYQGDSFILKAFWGFKSNGTNSISFDITNNFSHDLTNKLVVTASPFSAVVLYTGFSHAVYHSLFHVWVGFLWCTEVFNSDRYLQWIIRYNLCKNRIYTSLPSPSYLRCVLSKTGTCILYRLYVSSRLILVATYFVSYNRPYWSSFTDSMRWNIYNFYLKATDQFKTCINLEFLLWVFFNLDQESKWHCLNQCTH